MNQDAIDNIFELAKLLEFYGRLRVTPNHVRETTAVQWALDRARREFPREHREAMRRVLHHKDYERENATERAQTVCDARRAQR